ncbi:hypothetical protein ACFUAG_13495 [Streptomyces sp. NPDC057193]|uniref:hypothetical protein n=1 Tax=Streptomyces sp. NPDC057193 TaxID=3346043 RepID=UPI0036309F52
MDFLENTRRSRLPVAAYAWAPQACGPLMEAYRSDLQGFADRLRLPVPSFFEDSGDRADDERPALSCLLDLVAIHIFQVVLIPGPFVFRPGPVDVDAVVGHVIASGCRIVELPPPGA